MTACAPALRRRPSHQATPKPSTGAATLASSTAHGAPMGASSCEARNWLRASLSSSAPNRFVSASKRSKAKNRPKPIATASESHLGPGRAASGVVAAASVVMSGSHHEGPWHQHEHPESKPREPMARSCDEREHGGHPDQRRSDREELAELEHDLGEKARLREVVTLHRDEPSDAVDQEDAGDDAVCDEDRRAGPNGLVGCLPRGGPRRRSCHMARVVITPAEGIVVGIHAHALTLTLTGGRGTQRTRA